MLWGVMGCVAGFTISIVRERTLGTMLRLQAAPISRGQILAGKALACFLSVCLVVVFMVIFGLLLGMRPVSYPKLLAAAVSIGFCYVGVMMVLSQIGDTEQAVGSTGWAFNMIMAMLGGGMVPAMFLPGFLQTLGVISPVKWSIQAIEGAVWRGFTWYEMSLSLAILLGVGAVGITVGVMMLKRRDN